MIERKTASLGIAGGLTRQFIASALTPLFILAALAAGLVALVSLPREEEPQISVPLVDIHVQAQGLKAEDAVKLVTEPLEVIVKGINDVEHVYSSTRDDAAMVTARFEVGTRSEDAILRVHDKVRANIDRIPVGIPEPLIVGRGIDDVAILTLTLSAADLTRERSDPHCPHPSDRGRQDRKRRPYLPCRRCPGRDPDRARSRPAGALWRHPAATGGQGRAGEPDAEHRQAAGSGQMIDLVAGETLTAPAEVANLLITTRDGRPVYVADLARVAYVENTRQTIASHLTTAEGAATGGPAVTLAIAKRAGANAVVVAEEVLHRVEALEPKLIPEGVSITVTRDYGETANEKANELLFHLGLATVSIIGLVFFAIGWRESVVVAIVIPVTILLTLFAAWVMGYTLNRVSLFALIFSIGILVDDAIVVIENIDRHWGLDRRKSRIQAAIEAVAEVGNPTIVATLTVVAALLPMLFVSGLMGPYMSPIPANASAAMIFSFFVAVIITPWLMVRIAGRADMHDHAGDDIHGGHRGGWLERAYAAVARPVLASKGPQSWLSSGHCRRCPLVRSRRFTPAT